MGSNILKKTGSTYSKTQKIRREKIIKMDSENGIVDTCSAVVNILKNGVEYCKEISACYRSSLLLKIDYCTNDKAQPITSFDEALNLLTPSQEIRIIYNAILDMQQSYNNLYTSKITVSSKINYQLSLYKSIFDQIMTDLVDNADMIATYCSSVQETILEIEGYNEAVSEYNTNSIFSKFKFHPKLDTLLDLDSSYAKYKNNTDIYFLNKDNIPTIYKCNGEKNDQVFFDS